MTQDFGYGLSPLWSWNGRMTESGIREQIEWMGDVGFEGCFLHPRPGVKTKFLSDEWMERAQDAINETNARDMDLWLYDEDSYPSGFAGGQLLDAHPEYRARGLRYERADEWDDLAHESIESSPVSRVFAVETDGSSYDVADEETDADSYMAFWLAFAPDRARFNGHNYVDLRDPAAVDAFVDIVYGGYEGALGDQLEDAVVGVFTDEPNGAHHLEEPALMWTADLPSKFREANGYDLLERLPALVLDTDDAPAVRFDYYDLLNDLLVSNFTARVNEWCSDRDLLFTGHFWEHAWPDLSHTAAIMPHYAEMSVPGIDCLFRPEPGDEQMPNVLMVRELDSVCRQFDRRAMCETWGGAGWSVTRTDLKRMADWLLVLGVDFFVPHLVHYSLEGGRKRDWPPSYGKHFPGTEALSPLFDSMKATTSWLDAGDRRTSIAVLHPGTTVWTEWDPESGGDVPAGRSFREFVADLQRSGIEFDLIDESILAGYGGTGEDGLRVGTVDYETVVVPDGVTNVRAETADALAAASVDVLFVDDVDVHRVDGRSTDRDLETEWSAVRMEEAALRDRLRTTTPVTHDAPGDVHCRATRTDDEWRCFLVNRTDERVEDVAVRAPVDCGRVAVEDRFQSASWRVAADAADGGTTCEVTLRPYQSLCLTFDGDDAAEPSARAPSRPADGPDRIEPTDLTVRREGPNVAVLDFCDLRLEGDRREGEYVLSAQDAIFEAHGVDYRSQPFLNRHWWRLVRDGNKRRRGPGFEATFRFEVSDGLGADVTAVVENAEVFDVAVNGRELAFDRGTWLDDSFRCADGTEHVRPGANELSVSADAVSIEHPLEPAYLLGDFRVDAADPAVPKLEPAADEGLRAGSLDEQGHPFYTGWLRYEGTIAYDPSWGEYALDIGDFGGFAAVGTVNGTRIPSIGEPSTGDLVTDALVEGDNDVVVSVYVSPENALGPLHHERTPDEKGRADPWMFTPHGGSEFRREHNVGPSGLREPFALVRRR